MSQEEKINLVASCFDNDEVVLEEIAQDFDGCHEFEFENEFGWMRVAIYSHMMYGWGELLEVRVDEAKYLDPERETEKNLTYQECIRLSEILTQEF